MAIGGTDGRLIDGRFELLEPLGGGGMGLVWRARDTMLQREVALKEVRFADRATLESDPTAAHVMRERVLREARALARLQHVNVVTIHHIVDAPDLAHPWLVMELVQGGSLHDRLKLGPLTPAEAAHIGRGVLAALLAAHAAGIEHRDVKPGNVLLRLDGTPVLTDFGIAALQTEPGLTATGLLVGSPEYMAPERIRGQEGDPASDLWSLGMLLYVAVEGHHPLRRETSLATLAAVLDEPIPAPVHSGPLTPALAALLTRDPAFRPDGGTLDRMLADVERAMPQAWSQSQQPAHQPPLPLSPHTQHTQHTQRTRHTSTTTQLDVIPRRRKGLLVSCVIGTGVAGIAGVLAWTLHGSPASASGSHALGATPSTSPSSSPAPSSPSSPGTSSSSAAPTTTVSGSSKNLLTPAGVRAFVTALEAASGGTKVVGMTVYADHASAEVPTKTDPKVTDDYEYSNGALTASPDSTVDTSVPLIDLKTVDWNVVPSLITAAGKLGIAHPDYYYFLLDPDWMSYGQCFRVYAIDSYGAAYLVADFKGKVLNTVPR
jgi:serine/threonine protein kinase